MLSSSPRFLWQLRLPRNCARCLLLVPVCASRRHFARRWAARAIQGIAPVRPRSNAAQTSSAGLASACRPASAMVPSKPVSVPAPQHLPAARASHAILAKGSACHVLVVAMAQSSQACALAPLLTFVARTGRRHHQVRAQRLWPQRAAWLESILTAGAVATTTAQQRGQSRRLHRTAMTATSSALIAQGLQNILSIRARVALLHIMRRPSTTIVPTRSRSAIGSLAISSSLATAPPPSTTSRSLSAVATW